MTPHPPAAPHAFGTLHKSSSSPPPKDSTGSQSAPSAGDWHKNQLFPSAAASSPMSTQASPSESSASPDQSML
eukprot:CAMPEP_0196686296 /NCGR_PEP_ID=MMETSP1090-20130531/12347_1 /TAXON_ID=37098 /ORGANISM="Isochrysis sp, Strain CCMP1244" /LENGTH=72 /DNA_ID=CAMNT_0042024881 /DNA_START=93 /DNA_END=311 /DNA_ORIENTATION=+